MNCEYNRIDTKCGHHFVFFNTKLYFLIAVKRGREAEVDEWCRRKFEGLIKTIERVEKEDLQMPNHLLGHRKMFLRLSFENVSDLLNVRKSIMPIAEKNRQNMSAMDAYAEVVR